MTLFLWAIYLIIMLWLTIALINKNIACFLGIKHKSFSEKGELLQEFITVALWAIWYMYYLH